MKFVFDCNCSYESRVRVALTSIREKGSYWVEDEHLHFSRATGVITSWPFRFEGDQLLLREGGDAWYVYDRTEEAQCPADSEQ